MFHFHKRKTSLVAKDFLLTVLYFSDFVELWTSNEPCSGTNDGCKCSRSGKYSVDLSKIANTDGSPRFENIPGPGDKLYSYNPCFPFTQISSQSHTVVPACQNVAICVKNGTVYSATASQKKAQFKYDEATKELFVQYKHPGNRSLVTRVYLKCHSVESLVVHNTSSMDLLSPCVCKGGCVGIGGLSPGSIILLVFFSLLSTYFVIGCLVNKAIHGAEGQDIIPNYAGWTELLALIKDGYMFFLSPCLGDRVQYSNIYQNI